MCLIPELAMFGLSHRYPPWLHHVPSSRLLWGERAHPVAGAGLSKMFAVPSRAPGSLAPRAAALGSLEPWAAGDSRVTAVAHGTGVT